MRNPDRIDTVTDTLRRLWHYLPDWRLGQLVCNLSREVGSWDCFFIEDDKLQEAAVSWIKQAEEQTGEFIPMQKRYKFSTFADAVAFAQDTCGGENFEIHSEKDGSYLLLHEEAEEPIGGTPLES